MEKLTKTEITWTVSALELTINYYEQVARRSTNQMERGMAKLQAENLGPGELVLKLEDVFDGGPPELIDALVVVPHHAQVPPGGGQ